LRSVYQKKHQFYRFHKISSNSKVPHLEAVILAGVLIKFVISSFYIDIRHNIDQITCI